MCAGVSSLYRTPRIVPVERVCNSTVTNTGYNYRPTISRSPNLDFLKIIYTWKHEKKGGDEETDKANYATIRFTLVELREALESPTIGDYWRLAIGGGLSSQAKVPYGPYLTLDLRHVR